MTTVQKLRDFLEPELRRRCYPLSQEAFRAATTFAEDKDQGAELLDAIDDHQLRQVQENASIFAMLMRERKDADAAALGTRLQNTCFDISGRRYQEIMAQRRRRSAESVAAGKRPLCLMCLRPLQPIGRARSNGRDHDDWDSRELHKKCWKVKEETGRMF